MKAANGIHIILFKSLFKVVLSHFILFKSLFKSSFVAFYEIIEIHTVFGVNIHNVCVESLRLGKLMHYSVN